MSLTEFFRRYTAMGACSCTLIFGAGLGGQAVYNSDPPCPVHQELFCKIELVENPHSTDATTLTGSVTHELRLGENVRMVDESKIVIST